MHRPVIILHGYSDTDASFTPLAGFLKANGFNTIPIHLGRYITLEDQITLPDLAKAFEAELARKQVPTTSKAFDLVVHSTGALVAREWLTRYYLEAQRPCPLAHFLMLAPANFGSPIAHMGRTMFGRLLKGWKSRFETGTQVLKGLELASPYTRTLAERDLFGPTSFYSPDTCMAAVLVGSKPYQEGFRSLVDRNGSDGTVFVCTANLNTSILTVTFGPDKAKPTVQRKDPAAKPIALGVLHDRDHASICRPDRGNTSLGDHVVRFLKTTSSSEYKSYSDDCRKLTETTLPEHPPAEIFHTYQNLVAAVRDDLGIPVDDYFLEFYEPPRTRTDRFSFDSQMKKIHKEVLEDVHVYGDDPSLRSFLFDLTDLHATLKENGKLAFSLSAAPLSSLITYSAGSAEQIGELPVGASNTSFWRPNETLFIDLVIQRQQSEKVFKLVRA